MLYEFDGKRPAVGDETYVSETASIIGDVRVGRDCYIGHGVILRGDYGRIEINDETAIEEGVIVHAPPNECCFVGKGVVIGHGAIVHAKSIGSEAGIGMGSILSVRSEVGEGTIIAEGAVVKQNQRIMAGIVAAGNPARKTRDVTKKDQEFWAYSRQLYIDLAKKYLAIGLQRIE